MKTKFFVLLTLALALPGAIALSFLDTSETVDAARKGDPELYGHFSTVLTSNGQICTGRGVLKSLTISGPFGGNTSLFDITDDTDGSGASIFEVVHVQAVPVPVTHQVNIRFSNGAYLKESGDGTSWYVTGTYWRD